MGKRRYKVLIFFLLLAGTVWYVYFQNQFYTHLQTDGMQALVSFKSRHIKGFRGQQILVHKKFTKALNQLEEYAAKHEVYLIVNQSYRKKDQKINGAVVNPASRSNHIVGFAIDVNIFHEGVKYFSKDLRRANLGELPVAISSFIEEVRKDNTIRWGGDFKRQDPVHFDVPINHNQPKNWTKYAERCYSDVMNASYVWKVWD